MATGGAAGRRRRSGVGGCGTITTGTPDGWAMNGVVPSGSPLRPRVAEPALIAASVGSDASATSSTTVEVQRWAGAPAGS